MVPGESYSRRGSIESLCWSCVAGLGKEFAPGGKRGEERINHKRRKRDQKERDLRKPEALKKVQRVFIRGLQPDRESESVSGGKCVREVRNQSLEKPIVGRNTSKGLHWTAWGKKNLHHRRRLQL